MPEHYIYYGYFLSQKQILKAFNEEFKKYEKTLEPSGNQEYFDEMARDWILSLKIGEFKFQFIEDKYIFGINTCSVYCADILDDSNGSLVIPFKSIKFPSANLQKKLKKECAARKLTDFDKIDTYFVFSHD
uniref:Uncharacterized protein n=1 Tax=Marseillevirus LCMAC102 TaxID=2506603 RepID=A0A481YT83_9VIRU|nr:MAG: hypothetical protein LCMAC102_02430 [Marseillevirus LCMAC102]